MSTLIRPEISKRKEEWIPKHRYYELKHFCLQYPEWKKYLANETFVRSNSLVKIGDDSQIEFIDSTGDLVIRIMEYTNNIELIESVCRSIDIYLWKYLLEAVTKNKSWNYLKYVKDIPCSRNRFYTMYRKFFYELDKRKR